MDDCCINSAYRDSVTQKYFDVSIDIRNISSNPIYIWLMTCSWEQNFMINNDYIYFTAWACNKNIPVKEKFEPGESRTYHTPLVKSIKFDYPDGHTPYGQQLEETRLGLIILDDVFNRSRGFKYELAMSDKSKWRYVWSNSLELLN